MVRPHVLSICYPFDRRRRGDAGWLRLNLALLMVLGLTFTALNPAPTVYAATITVSTTADELNSDGDCSLREAIRAANLNAAVDGCAAGSSVGADTINLSAGTYTLTLTGKNDDAALTGDLDLSGSVTIDGQGGTATMIDGNNTDGVFDTFSAPAGTTIALSDLTIQHGNPTNAAFEGGGGIYIKNTVTMSLNHVNILDNIADTSGGGIWNEGTLTISNSTLSGNQANGQGGAIRNAGTPAAALTIDNTTISNNEAELGGGIYNSTDGPINLTITRSTIAGNRAVDRPGGLAGDFGDGAGIYVSTDGGVNLTNNTLSGNTAARSGGAIFFSDDSAAGSPVGVANLNNVTIHNNGANSDGDSGGDGGGVFHASGTVNVKNTIVAGNNDNGGTNTHPDISGTFTNQGNNLIGKNNGSVGFPTGSLVGTIATPVNHLLDALADNGGTTHTHALSENSPAIDAGNPATCAAHDQRGVARTIGAACDIGAYESADQSAPKITLTTDPSDVLAASGWYNITSSGTNGVKVNVVATDRSGVTNLTCTDGSATVLNTSAGSGNLTLANGTHSITCTATDGASPANTGAASGSTAMPASYQVDQVAPTLSPTVTPNPAQLNGSATLAANANDSLSGMATTSCDPVDTSSLGTYTVDCTVTDVAGNSATASTSYAVQILDSTPPVITPSMNGTLGNNGWYVSNVVVSWTVSDPDSAISSSTGCSPITISADSAGTTLTCTATSAGGTSSESVTIKRDATAPTLAPAVTPNPVPLNGSATATPNAADVLSGLAMSSCGSVNTSSVGPQSVTCTASDHAGNSASATAAYSVIYNFSGFFQPVDTLPTFNSVKAGSSIPVKFSLGGNQGLNILATGYPRSQPIACASSAPTDSVEETSSAGSSSLSYDAATDRYTYVWKTEKSWANSCRQLIVRLNDGTEQRANFKFTR